MFKLKQIVIKNWLSIEYIVYKPTPGAKLVMGVNNTDKGARSNGSGKSSFEEAIFYSAAGSSLRKAAKSELVRDDTEGAELHSEWYNEVTNTSLNISRLISGKGVEVVTFSVNGIQGEFDKLINANKLILELFGLTKDQLQSYFLLSRERYISFFRSPEKDKRDLVGKFSNANIIKKTYSIAESRIEVHEEKLHTHELKVAHLSTKISTLEEVGVNDTKEAFEERKEERLEQLDTLIRSLEGDIVSKNERLSKLGELVTELQKDMLHHETLYKSGESHLVRLTTIGKDSVNSLKAVEEVLPGLAQKLREITSQITASYNELNETDLVIQQIESSINGAIECPECSHKFLLKEDFTLEELSIDLKTFNEGTAAIRKVITQDELEKDVVNFQIEEANESIRPKQIFVNKARNLMRVTQTKVETRKATLNAIKRNITDKLSDEVFVKRDLKRISTQIDDLTIEIRELLEEEFLPNKEREKHIAESKLQVTELNDIITRIGDEKVIDLESLASLQNFYIYIINNSLSFIQQTVNKYLKDFHSDLSISLEGFKPKRGGGYSEKITPYIYKEGVPSGSYEKLSAGEKAKLELAQILTNQSIINNSLSKGEGLDILYVDEILDSVDGEGMESLIEAVNQTGKNCYIVTHITHDYTDAQELVFIKDNHITHLKE